MADNAGGEKLSKGELRRRRKAEQKAKKQAEKAKKKAEREAAAGPKKAKRKLGGGDDAAAAVAESRRAPRTPVCTNIGGSWLAACSAGTWTSAQGCQLTTSLPSLPWLWGAG